LDLAYSAAKTIHLVMDNLNIHSRKSLINVYGAEMAAEVWNRFTIHHTPTHGSWLNQADRNLLAAMSRPSKNPGSRDFAPGSEGLDRRINRDRVKIAWKFDRKTARRKFGYKRNLFKRS